MSRLQLQGVDSARCRGRSSNAELRREAGVWGGGEGSMVHHMGCEQKKINGEDRDAFYLLNRRFDDGECECCSTYSCH